MAVCRTLGVNNNNTTEYHPQTNDQTDRSNSIFISLLCHYVSKHQTNCDTYLLPLTYAYKVQIHRFIKVSPFRLALTPPSQGRPPSYQNAPAQRRTLTSSCRCTRGWDSNNALQSTSRTLTRTRNWHKDNTRRTTADLYASP